MIATRTSAGAIKKKKKSREAIKCLAEHMLMEMWVVQKSLHRSNCHNVTALFMTSCNDHVERSKADVAAASVCGAMLRWSPPERDEVISSRMLEDFFFPEVLSQLCPPPSIFPSPPPPSFTVSHTHTHTHTHTQVHSGLHDEWLRAPNLRDQAPRGTTIHQRCACVCRLVCVYPYRCWESRHGDAIDYLMKK